MNRIKALNHIVRLNLKNCDNCTITGIANYYATLGQGIVFQYRADLKELESIAESISTILNTAFNDNEKPSFYLTNIFRGINYGCNFLGIKLKSFLDY